MLLPAMVLSACGPQPFPGSGPVTSVGQPRPRKPSAGTGEAETGSRPPALAPLATQQQVVKAVKAGRQDPFGKVLTPILSIPPSSRPKAPPKANLRAHHTNLTWPEGLAFEGVLQTFSESEALVRYTPAQAKDGGSRYGALRVGDIGTGDNASLLPPGWQVVAIDAEQGMLMLQKGGQSVSQSLQKP
ncbi:MAG: hypothetical protein ACK587_02765 [Cyanobacteriota bacterium]